MTGLTGPAVRADRTGVVEIQQHSRMPHDCQHHVLELAGYMGTDGFLYEGRGHGGTLAAAERDGEVVGPEPHKAFAERRWRGDRVGKLGSALCAVELARERFPRLRLVLTILAQRKQATRRCGRIVKMDWVRLAYLLQKPCLWV